MPYIERNQDGDIIALHRDAQGSANEFLPATDPAVVQFLAAGDNSETPKQILAESDRDIAVVRGFG